MNLINGRADDLIPVHDRGFCYGDGIFRTFLIRHGVPRHWPLQYAKLNADCARLEIRCPEMDVFEQDLKVIADKQKNCVVKITVTRGSGARGYAAPPPNQLQPVRIVSTSPLPQFPPEYATQGITARLCNIRLAMQPVLAGVKHMNRLENVLARSEWDDSQIAEGIMLDTEGSVIAGTMSNLFLVTAQSLATPDLTSCGVAGVQRERVIKMATKHGIPLKISALTLEQMLSADEVFLVNSVIDIWQIVKFQEKMWSAGAMTAQFRQWLSGTAND